MSKIALTPNASGAGVFTIAAPNSGTNRTLTLPDEDGTLLTSVGGSTGNLTVTGNLSVDGGTIKLDGNYPVGTGNVALGDTALDSNVSGGYNTAIGNLALSTTTASGNVAVGYGAGEDVGNLSNQTMVGYQAGANRSTGNDNYSTVMVGFQAGLATTTSTDNTYIGGKAGGFQTGQRNVALGGGALYGVSGESDSDNNVAIGYGAFANNRGSATTTGNDNVAVGFLASNLTRTAKRGVTIGAYAGYNNLSGDENIYIGRDSGYYQTNGGNTAIGTYAMVGASGASSGSQNVAVGKQALNSNKSSNGNTAVGYQTGLLNTTGYFNTYVGNVAGNSNQTGIRQTFLGHYAGEAATGSNGTFVGQNSGYLMTTGSKNTILGSFSGNQGGLDIRTSSNNIVLSDGDGNPRYVIRSGDHLWGITKTNPGGSFRTSDGFRFLNASSSLNYLEHVRTTTSDASANFYMGNNVSGYRYFSFNNSSTQIGSISNSSNNSVSYNTTSDHRLKENVVYDWDATIRLKQLKPARFNFINDADTTVDGFLAHEAQAVVPEAVVGTHNEVDDDGAAVMQGIDQSKLVPLLVKTIQELEARITALEAN